MQPAGHDGAFQTDRLLVACQQVTASGGLATLRVVEAWADLSRGPGTDQAAGVGGGAAVGEEDFGQEV